MHTIAVVIPTLSRPSLERSVMSALQQSTPPNEMVIVENGQVRLDSDRVQSLLSSATETSIAILNLPPYSGPAMSRNLGAWHARSDYIAFLDDDDEYAPSYLERIRERIGERNPDVLYGAKLWPDEEGAIVKEKRLNTVPQDQWMDRLFCRKNHGFGGQNVVARRDAFFQVRGFPFDIYSGEDRAFAMAALVEGLHIDYVDEAEVYCHEPVGYRAKRRSDKWFSDIKIMRTHWNDVGWQTRVRASLGVTRSFVSSVRSHS